MNNSSSTLGTCPISVKKKGDDGTFGAFLTISRDRTDDNATNLSLAVWTLQDSTLSLWQGKVPLAEWGFLEESNEDRENLCRRGVHFFLEPPDKVETQWSIMDDGNLAVALRDSRKGITLTPWKSTLKNQENSTQACFDAFRAVHAERADIETAAATERDVNVKRQETLRQAAAAYQKTVQTLEGAWEKEKKELLSNFVKVYNARVALLQSQTEEVEQLQRQLQEAKSINTAAAPRRKNSAAPKAPDILRDVPEDILDVDETTASFLERGVPVPRRPAAKTTSKAAKTKAAAVRRNQVTGATEYMDADAAVEDVFGSDDQDNEDAKPASKPAATLKAPKVKTESAPKRVKAVKREPQKVAIKTEPAEETPPAKTKKVLRRTASSSDSDSSGPVMRRRGGKAAVKPPGASSQRSTTKASPEALSQPRRPRKRVVASSSSSSDSDDSNPTRRRRPTKKAAPVIVKHEQQKESLAKATEAKPSNSDDDSFSRRRQRNNTQSQKKEAESSATDDDDDIQANIMSQLAMLKKKEEEEDTNSD